MEDKKDRDVSVIPYQIVDFIPAPTSAQPVPSVTFCHSPISLHCRSR